MGLGPVAVGGDEPQALLAHLGLELQPRHAQPSAPVIEVGLECGRETEPVDRCDENQVGAGQCLVQQLAHHAAVFGHGVAAHGVALVDEFGDAGAGKVHPGLGGVGGQAGRGLAGQPFGVAHVARLAGRGDEEDEMAGRHVNILP